MSFDVLSDLGSSVSHSFARQIHSWSALGTSPWMTTSSLHLTAWSRRNKGSDSNSVGQDIRSIKKNHILDDSP